MFRILFSLIICFCLSGCVATTSTITSDVSYRPNEVYYESYSDRLVVYVESVPYYILWNSSINRYYYSVVPVGYRPYIKFVPDFRIPAYYRRLPNPYGHHKMHNQYRYKKPDKRKQQYHQDKRRHSQRPSQYSPPARPDHRSKTTRDVERRRR